MNKSISYQSSVLNCCNQTTGRGLGLQKRWQAPGTLSISTQSQMELLRAQAVMLQASISSIAAHMPSLQQTKTKNSRIYSLNVKIYT